MRAEKLIRSSGHLDFCSFLRQRAVVVTNTKENDEKVLPDLEKTKREYGDAIFDFKLKVLSAKKKRIHWLRLSRKTEVCDHKWFST